MKSAELREAFLQFFRQKGHTIVPSSPLVPANDPTLLFTNAGMVQFKDVFLGQDKRPYTRATSSQRCVRAGGKHNDLENVGYTARHHTFFEMLGNFSFGDYFKRDAIFYAWEFLTKVLNLPEEKLWVTIFEDDDEAAEIWLKELKVSPERFSRCGEKSNFWAMGDTGPCGPCSEIFYDHGPAIAGGPPGSPDEDGDRYIEIWNLVFMQFNRDNSGQLTPLPKPSVDTGMGLERISAVMQGVHNNYDIDAFQRLVRAVAELAQQTDLTNSSLRVIADHIRACSFLIVDGVLPSNEGRGYVLRRIIRRAVRHGHKLGIKGVFFHRLVQPLVDEMGIAYPELVSKQQLVQSALQQEEEQFVQTLSQGMKLLESELDGLKGKVIPGAVVFKLYDTYGFPADLTADIARERGLTIDEIGFEQAMNVQKQQSRANSQFASETHENLAVSGETEFTGYEKLIDTSAIVSLFHEGKPVMTLEEGQNGLVVLSKTPFYAESGGQVGDIGVLTSHQSSFEVTNTTKQQHVWLHHGEVKRGKLSIGQIMQAQVDAKTRQATTRNHSATHLLDAALRKILGEHVAQKGSLVAPERLRFDYSHPQSLSDVEIQKIETLVNEQVLANVPVDVMTMPIDEAKQMGAIALFGEKYGDIVRVVRMGEEGFSTELCGGTHVQRTGDIAVFKVIQESSVASGVRRLEALTGATALEYVAAEESVLTKLAQFFNTNRLDVVQKVEQLSSQFKALEKTNQELKRQIAQSAGTALAAEAKQVGDIRVLVSKLDGADPIMLREMVDKLKDSLGNAVVCLATIHNGKVNFVAGVTKNCVNKVHAGELVNFAAQHVGGKGGGRNDMAQAGGTQIEHIDHALAEVRHWVEAKL